ncbi:hypothetical protein ACFL1X_03340 [Candidatus Hydrogenedentota bacterium]
MLRLNAYDFDETFTFVRQGLAEEGGSEGRVFTISGFIVGKGTVEEIGDELDAILDAASGGDGVVSLSLRTGREFLVSRTDFTRRTSAEELVGGFTFELEASDPFEFAISETSVNWGVTQSGGTTEVSAAGNVHSKARITLVASGNVVNPSFSDGVRTISYSGTISDGESLVFNGADETVTLEGEDAVAYVSGDFPVIEPGGTTLTYVDDASSSHTGSVTVGFKDRWL